MGTQLISKFENTKRMPVLFVGHGSPMNIVAQNDYTRSLQRLAQELPRPRAILAISAHWETAGTLVLSSAQPEIINDFYGFPQALYQTGYTSKGAPEIAAQLENEKAPKIKAFQNWGLDHGTWSVLYHMYPQGDIPVTQLSLNKQMNFAQHMELAKEISHLRDQGVLILASGNLVHNLRAISWQEDAPSHDWALEFDAKVAAAIVAGDHKKFARPQDLGGEDLFRMAHPSLDHYLPILYALGAADENDKPRFVYEGMQNASVSMRSVLMMPA